MVAGGMTVVVLFVVFIVSVVVVVFVYLSFDFSFRIVLWTTMEFWHALQCPYESVTASYIFDFSAIWLLILLSLNRDIVVFQILHRKNLIQSFWNRIILVLNVCKSLIWNALQRPKNCDRFALSMHLTGPFNLLSTILYVCAHAHSKIILLNAAILKRQLWTRR